MARSEVVLSPLPFVPSGRKRNLSLLHSSSAWAVSLNCRQHILRFVSGSGHRQCVDQTRTGPPASLINRVMEAAT